MDKQYFRNGFGERIFRLKYANGPADTWRNLCERLVEDVCGTRFGKDRPLMSKSDREQLVEYMVDFKVVAGGRYLYYAGRPASFFNNCYLLRAEEDTREQWAQTVWESMMCLTTGGGIGVDYSRLRASGKVLSRTGGVASGPVPLMYAVNEIGRQVQQGGSRRSAIYASLNWQHEDIDLFLKAKNWSASIREQKELDFNSWAPLDMTNVSVNYDNAWLGEAITPEGISKRAENPVFLANVRQAMKTGEPGFSFNFGDKENETLRNACVPGDALILTSEGYKYIGDTVGAEVDIWNGEEWSTVKPFSTGINSTVIVSLSDGDSLECTPYHKWLLADGTRVCADELQVGDRLAKFEMPIVEEGVTFNIDPYSQGFYSGDGNTNLSHSWIYKPKEEVLPDLVGSFSPYNEKTKRWTWHHGPMFDKAFVPINGNKLWCLNWLAGLLDADGTVTRDVNGNGLQLCATDKQFLQDVQLMLTRLGCRAKVVSGNPEGLRSMPDGHGGHKEVFCKETHRLLIGNTDTYTLMQQGLNCNRLKIHSNKPQRDARRFVTVLEVIACQEAVETFCFTDTKAGRGTFNGIVTGNCTEVTSEDSSDVCNLSSVNLGNIESLEEFKDVVQLASKFLLCGTLRADLPYAKVYQIREKNRRLGLGLMGIHEWLLKRNKPYEVTPELHKWLQVYKDESSRSANEHSDYLFISRPVAYRAIAPTGSIGILAGTTTGIEPLFAVAYKRRYLTEGTKWKYEYVVDSTADQLIKEYAIDPDTIDTAYKLSHDYERRIKFQADVQDYVDMSISSTINLPAWGTKDNNDGKVEQFARTLAHYAPRLRGFTAYPDGARGGQPITECSYGEAIGHRGVVYEENDICALTGTGTCGS